VNKDALRKQDFKTIGHWQESIVNLDVLDNGSLKDRARYVDVAGTGILSGIVLQNGNAYFAKEDGIYVGDSLCYHTPLTSSSRIAWAEAQGGVIVVANGKMIEISESGDSRNLVVPAPQILSTVQAPGALPRGVYTVGVSVIAQDGREGPLVFESFLTSGMNVELSAPVGCSLALYCSEKDAGVMREVAVVPPGTHSISPGTGPSPVSEGLDSPPNNIECIALANGRLHASCYDPSSGNSAVFFSRPGTPHLFDMESDFFSVSGRVTNIVPSTTNENGVVEILAIVSEKEIYLWDGETLTKVADYGCKAMGNWVRDLTGKVYFWTDMGLAQTPGFTPITQPFFRPDTTGKQVFLSFIHDGHPGRVVSTLFN
jgi:hypothetical protein